MFVHDQPFQSRFVDKALGAYSRFRPYLQASDETGKVCQGQILEHIMHIHQLKYTVLSKWAQVFGYSIDTVRIFVPFRR